ncbi:hypothetical protein IEQ34_022492 [Dendrobium chrysotoxum]|uniref:Uncharacterized protein n=1 Tax=Dendrobium chrysotoxum TaxID=161865 RepID=A0AAV7FXV0_DENCH|nr:hypothetical protein IEQ34_022492 [Dendrobium chrysotoxum]
MDFFVKNEIGYKIGELERMNDFRQSRIKLLQNVKNAEEACSAKLCAEKWNFDFAKNVLDDLQPPKCSRNLSIKKDMGAGSIVWMNNVNTMFKLEMLKLTYHLE